MVFIFIARAAAAAAVPVARAFEPRARARAFEAAPVRAPPRRARSSVVVSRVASSPRRALRARASLRVASSMPFVHIAWCVSPRRAAPRPRLTPRARVQVTQGVSHARSAQGGRARGDQRAGERQERGHQRR